MIVHIHREPLATPWERALRLQGFGVVSLGFSILAVWNPVTQPGPTICLLRRAVGLPCPLCGMTRGVALCLRGHPIEASLFNPLTLPVLVLAVALAGKWALEFATGRRFDATLPPRLQRCLVYLGYGLLAVNWVYMLVYRREDPFTATWLGQLWTLVIGNRE